MVTGLVLAHAFVIQNQGLVFLSHQDCLHSKGEMVRALGCLFLPPLFTKYALRLYNKLGTGNGLEKSHIPDIYNNAEHSKYWEKVMTACMERQLWIGVSFMRATSI